MAPRVRSSGLEAARPVLLCTSGQPYVCEGGSCCDVSPDCFGICQGG